MAVSSLSCAGWIASIADLRLRRLDDAQRQIERDLDVQRQVTDRHAGLLAAASIMAAGTPSMSIRCPSSR